MTGNWFGTLNNDMIGNIEGVDGVIGQPQAFASSRNRCPPPRPSRNGASAASPGARLTGISRQLARYVHAITEQYMPQMNPMMIYRLDRFGRGGHHRPFNDLGFAGVRIMEAHENYNRQHQDIRTENGIAYGDVIEGVNFDYAKKLTAVNAITLAGIGLGSSGPRQCADWRSGAAVDYASLATGECFQLGRLQSVLARNHRASVDLFALCGPGN